MFPCTLSILKPIHTDYFPKQTRAFQADKGISGRKETDWKRLTVRFASKKPKKHILPFIAESKNILSGIFGHLWNSRKRLIHDSVIHWNKPTPLVRKFGAAIELAIPQFISAFAGWGFLCVSESSESTEYLLRHQGSIKAAHLFLSSGV